ncbi:sensor histidine kinase [Geobacter sp. OR-1]|uniref:sensor histidine kinase n=1 Tax=Geobacter sp. OR-1 TaxID=1266765 RepID=UPI0005AA295D|nr:HAMP domain-containing sensor histidine kinase [Geobacter sp. OR-1]
MNLQCCWRKDTISIEDCPFIEPGEESLLVSYDRRIVEKCLTCPRFASDLNEMDSAGVPSATLLKVLSTELLDLRVRLESMDGFLNSKTREIRFLHELSTVLQTSMDLDEVLSVAMTAITAGKGFGMNRAFLLMCDKDQQYLRGYLGVGPRTIEEAWHIWQEVEQTDLTLKEMAHYFQKNKLFSEKVKFQDILERLTVALDDHDHILTRSLYEKRPILVVEAFNNPLVSREFAEILGVDSFLIMPLISGNRKIGVMIADNFITQRAITHQDIQSIETFAFPVAFALVRASLYEQLHEEVEKLTLANRKLQEQQELIVKMEKMALVGRITSSIAHSIRNPLMVIGGFARSLLKSADVDDPKKEYLSSIIQEVRQLEDVLVEILNYSDSLYPVKDRWDLNQLLEDSCRDLQEKFAAADCGCRFELADDLPTVFIDYKQISYCVRTLLVASLENRSPGGEIVVSSRWWDNVVMLEIDDPHGNLTEDTWETMSPPFSSTQELGVAGVVGLPICRTILEKSGNSLTVERPQGGGMQYIIKLNLQKED